MLIGATALTGFLTGPDELNPYAQFVGMSPVANINGSVLVFRGRFDLPLVAATNHSKVALILADSGDFAQAVTEAQIAAALAADNALIRATLARILVRAQRPAEARAEYRDGAIAGSNRAAGVSKEPGCGGAARAAQSSP